MGIVDDFPKNSFNVPAEVGAVGSPLLISMYGGSRWLLGDLSRLADLPEEELVVTGSRVKMLGVHRPV